MASTSCPSLHPLVILPLGGISGTGVERGVCLFVIPWPEDARDKTTMKVELVQLKTSELNYS